MGSWGQGGGLKGPRGLRGRSKGSQRVKGVNKGFKGSSDDLDGIYAYMKVNEIFGTDGRTVRSRVVHEALVNLKMVNICTVKEVSFIIVEWDVFFNY